MTVRVPDTLQLIPKPTRAPSPTQSRKAMFRAARVEAVKHTDRELAQLNAEHEANPSASWRSIREYVRDAKQIIKRQNEWLNAITKIELDGGGEAELRALRDHYVPPVDEPRADEPEAPIDEAEPAAPTTPKALTPKTVTPTPRPVKADPMPAPEPKREPRRPIPPKPGSRRRRRTLTGTKPDRDEPRPPEEPRIWEHQTLEPGETIVMHVRRAATWYVAPWVMFIVLGEGDLVTMLLFALGGLITWWWINQDRYLITDKRVLARVGVFDKDAIAIRLDRIQDVIVHRPFWASFLRNGRVTIATAGGPTRELVIRNQPYPDRVASAIRGGRGR